MWSNLQLLLPPAGLCQLFQHYSLFLLGDAKTHGGLTRAPRRCSASVNEFPVGRAVRRLETRPAGIAPAEQESRVHLPLRERFPNIQTSGPMLIPQYLTSCQHSSSLGRSSLSSLAGWRELLVAGEKNASYWSALPPFWFLPSWEETCRARQGRCLITFLQTRRGGGVQVESAIYSVLRQLAQYCLV